MIASERAASLPSSDGRLPAQLPDPDRTQPMTDPGWDHGSGRDDGPVCSELVRADCQVPALRHHQAKDMQGAHANCSIPGLQLSARMALLTSLEAQLQNRKAAKLIRRLMHALQHSTQDAQITVGVKRGAAEPLQPEQASKRPMLNVDGVARDPAIQQNESQNMDWEQLQLSLPVPLQVLRPQLVDLDARLGGQQEQQQAPSVRVQPGLLIEVKQAEGGGKPPSQPPAVTLSRAGAAPPPGAKAPLPEQGAEGGGGAPDEAALPADPARVPVSRCNIVKRLAELGTAGAAQQTPTAATEQGGEDAVQQMPDQAAQQAQHAATLERRECGAYARRIGRFLGCGEGAEECLCDKPAHLLSRAALNRYLTSQVGIAKDEVWQGLNGEVGGVLMKRLVSRSAALAKRRSSVAPPGAAAVVAAVRG